MIVIHYRNVRMHNIPKVNELRVNQDNSFVNLFIKKVTKKVTTLT